MRRYVVLAATAVALYIAQGEFREHLQVIQKEGKTAVAQASIKPVIVPVREAASLATLENMNLSPIELANQYLEAHRAEWKIQPYHELRPVEFKTPISTKVKYSVFQDGVPVLNMDISIQIEKDMTVGKVENTYVPIEKAKILEKETKIANLIPIISDRYKVMDDPKLATPPVIVVLPGHKSPEVAFQLSVIDKVKKNAPVEILFRASDGQILAKTRPRAEF